MRGIERKDLRIGFVISYAIPGSSLVLHGEIIHIGVHLDEPRLIDCLYVESLDFEEGGLTEIVYLSQVVRKG